MRVARVLLALGAVLTASLNCTDTNPAYCTKHGDCPPDLPVCNYSIHACIQPNDDGGDLTGDSDAPAVATLYVDDQNCSDTGDGTQEEPFCTIGVALQHAGGSIRTIQVLPGTYSETIQISTNVDLIAGQGAQIETDECPGILILGGARVTIEGFTISGAGGIRVTGQATHVTLTANRVTDTDCYGVDCQGQATCFVNRNTLIGNQDFGVRFLNTTYGRLENNIIAKNGASGQVGGLWIDNPGAGSSFVNNTVAKNDTELETSGGVTCVTPVDIINHIIWDNEGDEVSGAGPCAVSFSDVKQETGVHPGEGNISEEPLFVSGNDFHILPDSPCVDRAHLGSAPNDDIDGQRRHLGAGADMGADEVQ